MIGRDRAYAVTRRKDIAKQRLVWRLCQRYPRAARRLIRHLNAKQLAAGYPADEHFKPVYNPWDQRLCAVPDADMFKAIRDGRASVVTEAIDTLPKTESGCNPDANWRPTSASLPPASICWPSVASTSRSTESPWTLPRRWHSRVSCSATCPTSPAHMDAPGHTICCPQLPAAMPTRPLQGAEAPGGPQGVARGPGRRRSPALYDVGFGEPADGEAHHQEHAMELMSPIDALFLSAESREHPLHVGALQLFEPPAGAGRGFVRETYQAMLQCREIAPLFRKRPTSLHGALINLGWSTDADVDLGYHARRSALPAPGRVRELLELTSRLHSNLLDRHRPLWETHVIEGLRDGRFAIYSKMHHALVDGVSGLTLMRQPMTTDPIEGKLRTAWSPATQHTAIKRRRGRLQQLGACWDRLPGSLPQRCDWRVPR